mgnify:CR=1 FL=1
MSKQINTNGKAKTTKDATNQEVVYPIDFEFKAVMDATVNDDDNKESLVEVFNKNKVKYLYHDKKISTKGTYVSFTYKVTIVDKKMMESLYADLKGVKGLKFAL